MVAGKGLIEVGDNAVLVIPEPFAGDGRHQAEAVAEAGAGRFEIGFEPGGEGFGTVKAEDGAAAGVGFEEVGEARLDAGGFVAEGEGPAWRGEVLGKPDAVFGGLDLDTDQGNAGLLGFHDAGSVAIDVEEVVGETVPRSGREFANGDAAAGFNIDAVAILDEPPGAG